VQVEKDRLSIEARQEADRINELLQAEQAVRSCLSSSAAASSSVWPLPVFDTDSLCLPACLPAYAKT
jgi:hypothetical protein